MAQQVKKRPEMASGTPVKSVKQIDNRIEGIFDSSRRPLGGRRRGQKTAPVYGGAFALQAYFIFTEMIFMIDSLEFYDDSYDLQTIPTAPAMSSATPSTTAMPPIPSGPTFPQKVTMPPATPSTIVAPTIPQSMGLSQAQQPPFPPTGGLRNDTCVWTSPKTQWLWPSLATTNRYGKYSVCLVIPKQDPCITDLNTAISNARQLGGTQFANCPSPLKDGDLIDQKTGYPFHAGMFYFTTTTPEQPPIIDPQRRSLDPAHDVSPGCVGAAYIGFFPYSSHGGRGISCRLLGLVKIGDGVFRTGHPLSHQALAALYQAHINTF